MIDVRRLQVLRAVVTCGSITAAAVNLGYTPSAISQQVAALEKEAKTPLLERVGRGVQPTAAGRLLTAHAAIIADQVAAAELELGDLRAGHTARLGIQYFATAGTILVPPAVARLRRDHPHVRVELTLTDPHDPLPDIDQGSADLAIVVRPKSGVPDSVRLTRLLDDPFCAVLPQGHRLQARTAIDLTELAEENWVDNERPAGLCMETIRIACASAGFSPNFVVESENYATAQGFVAAGLGVSVIPRMGLGTLHPQVVVRPLRNPEPVRTIYAAVRKDSLHQAALTDVLDTLRVVAAAHDISAMPVAT